MVIFVKDIVDGCDTNSQGDLVRFAVQDGLDKCQKVTLDFTGITSVTSSFINSALITLVEKHDLLSIKNRVVITKVNRQIGTLIRDRFSSKALLDAQI